MTIPDSVRQKLIQKQIKILDLEIKKLDAEINASPPLWEKILTSIFRWLLQHVPLVTAIGAIITVYVGIMSYEKDILEKRDARFYSLVQILQSHSGKGSSADLDIATAAIGAIRSSYSNDGKYAFSIAFFVMPYAVMKTPDSSPIRRIASETLSDAIYLIDDYSEFQSVFRKWYAVVGSLEADVSDEIREDSGRVVCALGHTIKKFGLPGPSDMSACPPR